MERPGNPWLNRLWATWRWLNVRLRQGLIWFRNAGYDMTTCAGCNQPIDTDFLTTHVWSDADDQITVTYHIDCCVGKHVSLGECQEILEPNEDL